MNGHSSMKKPCALIILDGFALREQTYGNAVAQANKPNFDRYWNEYPHTTLTACGEAVGLPEGQMGNSEVGHLNMGAGRIVYQDLTRINKAIRDGSFKSNAGLNEAMDHAKSKGTTLHLYGLLSDGGVHSHQEHVYALLELAKENGVPNVCVHGFLDGRDVSPDSAQRYVKQFIEKTKELGIGQLASIHGRYYAMDRDKRWDRVEKTYRALVYGEGQQTQDPVSFLKESYKKEVFDEFVEPTIILDENHAPVGTIQDEDAVIFFNFRPDRSIQLSSVFTEPTFDAFDRGKRLPERLCYVCLTHYSEQLQAIVAFKPSHLSDTLGEVISKQGLQQLRIAETEKYPHVTYFFNGGREVPFDGEARMLIDSPKVATYDLQPEMSAPEVTTKLVAEIEADHHDVIILNFANADMVGHSGKIEPTILAVEAVDECLGKVVDALIKQGGVALITADHGNADQLRDEFDNPHTAHTTNPVPFVLTQKGVQLRDDGILADLSPTLLEVLNIEQPSAMTGKSLKK